MWTDTLSRHKLSSIEWTLDHSLFLKLVTVFGKPQNRSVCIADQSQDQQIPNEKSDDTRGSPRCISRGLEQVAAHLPVPSTSNKSHAPSSKTPTEVHGSGTIDCTSIESTTLESDDSRLVPQSISSRRRSPPGTACGVSTSNPRPTLTRVFGK